MADIPLNLTMESPYGNPVIPDTRLISDPGDTNLKVKMGDFIYSIDKKIFPSSTETSANFIMREEPTGSYDSSNTEFYLEYTPVTNKEQVFLNGALLEPGDDYTLVGDVLTMIVAPSASDKLRVTYIRQ